MSSTRRRSAQVIAAAEAYAKRINEVAGIWLVVVLPSAWLRAVITRHAVPTGQPARRTCPHCDSPLTWSAYLPIGRCRQCCGRVGPARYLVELALLAAAVLLVAGPRGALELPAYAWFAGAGIGLAYIDAAVRRLPNWLTACWAGGTLLGLAAPALVEHRGGDWLRAVLAGLAVPTALALLGAVLPGSVGWGDIKAGVAIGAATGWLSWAAVYAGVFVAFALASGYGISLLLRRRAGRGSKVVFGPFLVAGALIVTAFLP